MRVLLLGVATIALSGCSWIGIGGHGHHGQYKSAKQAGCCVGGKTLSRWNMEAGVGPEFTTGGDAITGSDIHPGVAALGLGVNNVTMKDAYKTGVRAELGGSYALNPNRKLTMQGFYSEAQGEDIAWGRQGVNTLRGKMNDYKS